MRRIAARYLYTLQSFEPLANGFAEVDDDGKILSVGTSASVEDEKEYYDGIVLPGFVNTHCHLELSSLRGMFRRGTGMAGFIDQINTLRDFNPKDEKLRQIKYWIDLMWERGVSAMGDISNCDDSFAAKAASGIYTRTFLEVFGTEPSDCEAVMKGVKELQAVAETYGLDAAPTPHACYTMSPELLEASSSEALKSGFLSFHSEETIEEEQMLKSGSGALWENRRKAGMSVPQVTGRSSLMYFIDRLRKVHEPPFDEHILLVHEVCMDEEGADAVNEYMRNAYIALCPMSNIFIHNALPPVEMFRRKGLKLTVGTDSLSSNDDLNPVTEILCLQNNFPSVPLGEIFTWACRNGAEFLGKQDRFGSVAVGKNPGLVFIDHIGNDGLLTTSSTSHRII